MPTEAPTPKQPKQTPIEELEMDDDAGSFDDFDDEPMQLPIEKLKVEEQPSDLKSATKTKESTENFGQFVEFDGNADEEEVMDVTENTKENALQMYWIETFEDPYERPGKVFLFGRVNNKSCCVVAKNIEHKVYFVPREFDENGDADFTSIRSEDTGLRTKEMDVKFVSTFDASTNDVANERKTLMTLYKGSLPKISPTTQGKTFSKVLNTTATAMERLLLELKLRGPCWIEISNQVEIQTNKDSHCELEYTVDMKSMKNIRPVENKITGLPISLLSFYICSGSSTESKETEILMIVCLLRPRVLLDCTTANTYENSRPYKRYCFVAPPENRPFPYGVDKLLKAKTHSDCVIKMSLNERSLLTEFLDEFKNLDPDVVVAHDISAQLTLLMSRIDKHGISKWSFIGRLRHSGLSSRLTKTKAGQWGLMAGRSALCSKTSAEELFPTRSYELEDLLTLLAPEKTRTQWTFSQMMEIFESIKQERTLPELIQWAWAEAFYPIVIVSRLNALPLFVQITQIVGGVLSRTLLGGRAERNEYLLLHAFHETNYVPPDKKQFAGERKKGKQPKSQTEDKDEGKNSTSKKAQYTGGLVLEPKKGFYDHYIYNICFTTIPRCYEEPDENGLPDPPKESTGEGILPKEIRKLIDKRNCIKKRMKSVRVGSDDYMKLDVQQKGLKLTANSMYGCLGFNMSRFCAKTLAAMITSKGRELLSQTKDIVERQGYVVVYGDTDSIMVNTNTSTYKDAQRLAENMRKIVNGRFKHVEMDIDDEKREMKGLDIVRRDWSTLAREIGEQVVDSILYSTEREELINEVVKKLNELAEEVKNHKKPIEKFEILKQLTKAPKDYTDTKAQPHVLVALRLNQMKTHTFRAGDVVKYVICEQVHPVVMRLCEPFVELDACRIAEALGLDSTSYRNRAPKQSMGISALDTLSDAFVAFDIYNGFTFECPECKKQKPNLAFALESCPECKCDLMPHFDDLEFALIQQLNDVIKRYGDCKYVCEDQTCAYEEKEKFMLTWSNSYGPTCPQCKMSVMQKEFSLKDLFYQQKFYKTIFDWKSCLRTHCTDEQKKLIKSRSTFNKVTCFYDQCENVVTHHLKYNRYNRVKLKDLFRGFKTSF
ncbi:DNA polymerase [Aphelenchoides besseyi]|nr:DNA polymerase [Aphelenchoides besseyi]